MNAFLRFSLTLLMTVLASGNAVRADGIEYSYEGDVLLTDSAAGWSNGDPCVPPCMHFVKDGHFVVTWDEGGRRVNYGHPITEPPEPPLESLWVEWNFSSNYAFSPTCGGGFDGTFIVRYKYETVFVYMFGDAAMDFGAIEFRGGLEIDEFHTYRYESRDGLVSRVYVDGELLFTTEGTIPRTTDHNIQIGGAGGCDVDLQPTFNRYDYVRYGTISFGEQIIASDPPAGVLGSVEHPGFDLFTVTFDSPNYVLIDEVTVDVTQAMNARSDGTFPDGSGSAHAAGVPQVIKTRRPVNGPPDTVEIVLDGPLPLNATTTFTFDDGVATNVVEYTYVETGACCLDDGTCAILDGAECMAQGGFFSPNEPCSDPTPCCFNGACEVLPPVCCTPLGGAQIRAATVRERDTPPAPSDGAQRQGSARADAPSRQTPTRRPTITESPDHPITTNPITRLPNYKIARSAPADPPESPLGKGGRSDLPESSLGKGGGCEGDVDGDGVDALCGDGCPADPFKAAPGQCGCGVSDVDSDNDTVADCLDQCPGEDDTIDEDADTVPDCLQFQPIPTTTAWGIAVLALLLLIAAKAAPRRTA